MRKNILSTLSSILIALALLISTSTAVLASTCTTTNSTDYDITVCLDAPASNPATLTGDTTITGSYNNLTLRNGAKFDRLEFRYTPSGGSDISLASLYKVGTSTQFTFTWHTDEFIDMTNATLSARAIISLSGVHQESDPASQTVTLSNSVTTTPVNTNTFTPVTYDAETGGHDMVVSVVGDGSSNEENPVTVSNLMDDWNPDMSLYLGDVYYRGTHEEFQNFYESTFGQFKDITNPVVGNHEYLVNTNATGYMWYWDNIPNYYSYDASGWHFIALNTNYSKIATTTSSTGTYSNSGPGGVGLVTDNTKNWRTNQWVNQSVTANGETHFITANSATQLTLKEAWTSVPSGVDYTINGGRLTQQAWLEADLAANTDKCIIAYAHHPRWSIGSHGGDVAQNAIWNTFVDNKVTTFLVGHDHSYQRWTSMGLAPSGDATPSGVNSFVIGTGGHGSTSITGSDSKVLSSIANAASYGAMKMAFTKSKYDFEFHTISPLTVYDSGTVYCQGKGSMHGSVVDNTSQPVSGATVSYSGTTATGTVTGSTTTDGSGNWSQSNLPAGEYSITFSKSGYINANKSDEVGGATDTTVDTVTLGSSLSLSGTVTDTQSNPVEGAIIWTPLGETETDASGNYTYSDWGTRPTTPVVVKGSGIVAKMAGVTPTAGTPVTQNFTISTSVFEDDFESGNLNAWTTNNNMTMQSTTVNNGTNAPEGNTTSTAMNLRKTLGSTYASLNMRSYFNVKSQGSGSAVGLVAYRNSSDSGLAKVYLDGTGKLCFRNEVTATNTCSTTTPSQNAWHSVELQATINGTSSEAKVWYDGAEVTSLTLTGIDLGTNNVGRVVVGEVNSGRTFDVVFDDVVVAQGRVDILKGVAKLTTNDWNNEHTLEGVTVSYSGGSTTTDDEENAYFVNMPYGTYSFTAGQTDEWESVTHDLTVSSLHDSSYSFLLPDLKGTIEGTITDVSSNPLSDVAVTISGGSPSNGTTQTTASDGTYKFQRVVTGPYRLTLSKAGYATETRGAVSYANAVDTIDESLNDSVFSDDFESGALTNWTTNNNMTNQSTTVHFGSDAVEGNTTSTAMNLRKTLGTTYNQLFYRTYFNMKSIGSNNVGLLWFRTSTDGALFKTYMDGSTGKLCTRNDISSTTTCSTTMPSTNAWHELEQQVIVNGTSSTHKVWLDGVEVTDLTSTSANLGSNGIGRIYVGETSSGRTYDVVFDDVQLSTSRVGAAGGKITGTVRDASSNPVSGATVTIAGKSTTSDGSGNYIISDIFPENYTITASKSGYSDDSVATIINPNVTTISVDFALTPTGTTGTISGTVTDAGTSSPISGVTVSYSGGNATTDGSGNYTLSGVTAGTYTLTASKSGYETQTANNVTVTTGNTTDQDFAAPQLIMSDDFESNTFNAWTTNNNMTMQGTTIHGGSYAPQGNANGSVAMNLRKTLSTSHQKIYYRAYVYIDAQTTGSGMGIGLVSVRSTSDSAIAKVYIDGSTSKLCIRNEVTATNTCSNTVPAQDTWHSVELYTDVNGTSSTHKVWLNGTEETALTSTTADLGSTLVGRLVLGEINSGRTYNVFFDDVLAKNVYVGQ